MTTWDLWLISEGGISCELQIVSKLDCFRGYSQYHRELYDSQWSVVRARESRRNTGNVSSFYRGHSLIPFQDRDTSIFLLYEWRNSLKNVKWLALGLTTLKWGAEISITFPEPTFSHSTHHRSSHSAHCSPSPMGHKLCNEHRTTLASNFLEWIKYSGKCIYWFIIKNITKDRDRQSNEGIPGTSYVGRVWCFHTLSGYHVPHNSTYSWAWKLFKPIDMKEGFRF